MHALSCCDIVSYPYGKGKKSALTVLVNNDIDGLQDVLGEPDISQGQLKATAGAFFLAPTTVNIRPIPWIPLGIKCTWGERSHRPKEAATDRQQPATTRAPSPSRNDSLKGSRSEASTSRRSWHPPFRLECQGRWGCYTTGIATWLLGVVSCSCSAERKVCSEKRCSCHNAGLSCSMEYCYCEGGCVLQSLQ